MIQRRLCFALAFTALAALSGHAWSSDRGSKEEARALSDAATAHIKKVEDKSAYIQRVAGADMLVGVGVYR